MTSKDIREKYIKFFVERGHKQISPSKLVPENDPTTLFTSSGMQPLVPYLLGQEHPEGKKLVDSQPSFRAEDIEEVGDNRHTTFFEMLGNWSLGAYFQKEQLNWIWEFLTKDLSLNPKKLYVSVFEGNDIVPKDEQSYKIWKEIGVPKEHIYFYGVEKNWWSRSGTPDKMPVGEIGGFNSEIFFEFTQIEHNIEYGKDCHPQCDCGRFLEIGNSVFLVFKKVAEGEFEKLEQKNVDFGGGLERLTAAVNEKNDIFQNDLHFPIIEKICQEAKIEYGNNQKTTQSLRIISDHIKAATFLIKSGVAPYNKLQGYVLRRLLRRAAVKLHQLDCKIELLPKLVDPVIDIYEGSGYFEVGDWDLIRQTVLDEVKKFEQTLAKGLKEVEKIEKIDGKIAFDLYQTFGFPYEVTEELFSLKGQQINREEFKLEFEKHKELSRTASAGMFKGGLADHSETVTKYHTATHLLHQALRDILGPQVFQKGSNITSERLRFDFSYERKMTEEEIKKVEEIVNRKIDENLKVDHMTLDLEQAKKMNAIGLFLQERRFPSFNEKYAQKVSLYGVGLGYKLESSAKDQRNRGGYYSLEFCGGPHVEHTGVISKIKIVKEEAISAGVRRIRAQLA